jgi:hypothetical protein
MDNIKEDGVVSAVPANAMGGSSSTAGAGGIDTFDPLMKKPKKKLSEIITRKTLGEVRGSRN